MNAPSPATGHRIVGRYAIYGEIASGGMATVHLGRLLGEAGFSRTVAIKRLHEQFAKDPDFVAMFLDEARLASRIRHTNVVSTLDVVAVGDELFLVMDYVQGESLSKLVRATKRAGSRIPTKIALSIVTGTLHGLHAAHEAKSETGELLGIVHRDVSPQNVLVDTDGLPQVIDFGVAKAAGRLQSTREGTLKGKLQYMPPEQIETGKVDRRTDVYAASVMLWEVLTGQRMFRGDNEAAILNQILDRIVKGTIDPPSKLVPSLPTTLDQIVLKGLAARPDDRWATAREMAVAIEKSLVIASARQVGEWVEGVAGEVLKEKAERVAEVEAISTVSAIGARRPAFSMPSVDTGGMHEGDVPPEVMSSTFTANTRPDLPRPEQPFTQQQHASQRRPMILALIVGGALLAAALVIAVLSMRLLAAAGERAANGSGAATQPTATGAIPAGNSAAEAIKLPPEEPPPTARLEDLPEDVEPPAEVHPPPRPPTTKVIPAAKPPNTGIVTEPKPPSEPKPPPPAPKPPKASCDPPYTIDANGIKRYKPECL